MKNIHIYILTDSNRKYLHVGMTSDLEQAIATYNEMYSAFFGGYTGRSRMVYQQAFINEEEATKCYDELSQYTRMQKEKLIRYHNPNWVDISRTPEFSGFSIRQSA